MSLSPQQGQGAPSGVDVDPAPAARHTAEAASAAPQAPHVSSYPPVPENTPSTTWGTTSTVQGAGSGSADRAFSAPAINHAAPDAPTAAMTYPPESAAPGRGPTPAPGRGPAGRGQRGARARGPRRARLQLRHIDAWTVLKFSCVLSIALFFVWLIVIGVLFGVLDATGIIGKINDSITTINGGNAKPPVTPGIVFGGAAIIGVVNIVLFIAITTIGSVVYNLCADLVGGIEVTLSER